MQRSGLIHISSMTPVCEAPRADRAQVLSCLSSPPWKTHLWSVCQHQDSRPRLKKYDRGGVRALRQCLTCGRKASNFISNSGVTEAWDVDLEDRIKADYDLTIQAWEHSRIQALDGAENAASHAWWNAYDEYLKTSVWALKRELVLQRCNGVCESCFQRPAAHVHHLKYPKVFGLEPLWDLKGVCIPCHKLMHPHME